MAIVTYSPLVASATGSVAATTFKRHRAGFSVERKPRPPRLRHGPQQTIRQTVSRLAWVWRTLDTAARLKWRRYADALRIRFPPDRLPGLVYPYNLFLAYNIPSVALLGAVQEAPPSSVGFCPPPKLTITFYSPTLIGVNFNLDPLLSGETMLCYFSRPFPRSQTNPRTWTGTTRRFVGPISTPQNVTQAQATVLGLHMYCKFIRHSIVALDSLPQIIRTAWAYP